MKPSDSLATEILNKKLLCQSNSQILYKLDLDTIESLSQETFHELISYHKSSNKSCIIAVVKSRDLEQLNQFYQFFFDAFQLNKLIFKKKNNDLIGRHDKTSPMSVINPLTNTLIVGEVEYFLVKNSENNEDVLKAELIGTDYSYLFSEELRKVFEENALKPEDLKFNEVVQDNRINLVNIEIPQLELEILQREIDEEIKNDSELFLKIPFVRAFMLGIIFFSYFIIIYVNAAIAVNKVRRI